MKYLILFLLVTGFATAEFASAQTVKIKVPTTQFSPGATTRQVSQVVKVYAIDGYANWKNFDDEDEEKKRTRFVDFCSLQLDYYVDIRGNSRHYDRRSGRTTYDSVTLPEQVLTLHQRNVWYGPPEGTEVNKVEIVYEVESSHSLGIPLETRGLGRVFLSRIDCARKIGDLKEKDLKPMQEFKGMISRYFSVVE